MPGELICQGCRALLEVFNLPAPVTRGPTLAAGSLSAPRSATFTRLSDFLSAAYPWRVWFWLSRDQWVEIKVVVRDFQGLLGPSSSSTLFSLTGPFDAEFALTTQKPKFEIKGENEMEVTGLDRIKVASISFLGFALACLIGWVGLIFSTIHR